MAGNEIILLNRGGENTKKRKKYDPIKIKMVGESELMVTSRISAEN
jgi:hypothetical protein